MLVSLPLVYSKVPNPSHDDIGKAFYWLGRQYLAGDDALGIGYDANNHGGGYPRYCHWGVLEDLAPDGDFYDLVTDRLVRERIKGQECTWCRDFHIDSGHADCCSRECYKALQYHRSQVPKMDSYVPVFIALLSEGPVAYRALVAITKCYRAVLTVLSKLGYEVVKTRVGSSQKVYYSITTHGIPLPC
jgi:hypothetical protein